MEFLLVALLVPVAAGTALLGLQRIEARLDRCAFDDRMIRAGEPAPSTGRRGESPGPGAGSPPLSPRAAPEEPLRGRDEGEMRHSGSPTPV